MQVMRGGNVSPPGKPPGTGSKQLLVTGYFSCLSLVPMTNISAKSKVHNQLDQIFYDGYWTMDPG